MKRCLSSGCLLILTSLFLEAQVLDLPPRPARAPTGTEFTHIVSTLSREEREQWVYAQVVSGNVPTWLRALTPITVSAAGHTATYYVTPDYVAIGSDRDYLLQPMTPVLAQRLCDRLGCALPTRKMVNQIWAHAAVKLAPAPIPPSPEMTTVPVFAQHNALVRAQREGFTNAHPLGALVGGHKKDVVLSARIYTNFANAGITTPVVIYGWHQTNGSPIQPLYNGHGETYADYSHGIRLVQMQLWVDGSSNTLTNVLSDPALASLLSDEGPAEGSPDGTLPLPRYTVALHPPVIITHPRSQSALPGAVIRLETLAIGDAPLSYRWQRNGLDWPLAYLPHVTVDGLSAAEAGVWSVVVTNPSGSATSRVAVIHLQTNAFPRLFSDDFETNSPPGWRVLGDGENGLADHTADFSFDYGATPYTHHGVTALIPAAPNSSDGSTRALRLAVNQDAVGARAAVNVYPEDLHLSGTFALKFDLWINYPGQALGNNSTGSTQHALCGIHHAGTRVNWATTTATASDGLWFAASGEGGDSRDYRAYVGDPGGAPLDLTGSPASGLIATNHTAGVFQALFPATRFETAGAPGKNWVQVELRQVGSALMWLMDGTPVASRTNTSTFTNGTFMLGLMDVFPSIANPARDSFVLVDNVRIENLSPPIQFKSIWRQSDGTVLLELSSALGDAFWLETSSNLSAWQPLGPLLASNQPASFTDALAPGNLIRFYRARR